MREDASQRTGIKDWSMTSTSLFSAAIFQELKMHTGAEWTTVALASVTPEGLIYQDHWMTRTVFTCKGCKHKKECLFNSDKGGGYWGGENGLAVPMDNACEFVIVSKFVCEQ